MKNSETLFYFVGFTVCACGGIGIAALTITFCFEKCKAFAWYNSMAWKGLRIWWKERCEKREKTS